MNTDNVILTVSDVAKILHIGIKGSYKLFKHAEETGFPCRIIGNKFVVGREAFFAWLNHGHVAGS